MTTPITIAGNLTRDPELRFTNGGKAIASFGVAVSRRFQQNGEWQESTSFYTVKAWDQLGENAAASLVKGARCIVTGRLDITEFTGRDGSKRMSAEITAEEIGAALRWATVEITRTERTGGSERQQQNRARQTEPEPYYGGSDEEPF